MKLFFVFAGDMHEESMGEGSIAEPKFVFKTKEAAERYMKTIAGGGGGDGGGAGGGGEDSDDGEGVGGGLYSVSEADVKGAKGSAAPTHVFEVVCSDAGCDVFLGLFASKALAEKRLKADDLMDNAFITAVEVLDEHIA